jgi:hypothetical protein
MYVRTLGREIHAAILFETETLIRLCPQTPTLEGVLKCSVGKYSDAYVA